jgi:DNA-binding response OmpR family regulator
VDEDDDATVRAAVAPQDRENGERAPLRVLVIDDDAKILDLIKNALGTKRGYEVVTASHGVEGLDQFYRQPPDCVIVDVQMPKLNGFQFLRAIRGDPTSSDVPVIVMSIHDEEAYQRTAAYSGVDEYLPKPFKLSVLYETIERVLRITAEERARRQQRLAGEGTGDGG